MSLNKNIIFYSNFPHDKLSQMCLAEIERNADLSRQFLRICVHHPRNPNMPPTVNLPRIVVQLLDRVPIIAISGFTKPIFAYEALKWLQSNQLKGENTDIRAGCIQGTAIADNCATVEQAGTVGSEFFNTEYNMSFTDGKGEFNKVYSNLEDNNRIITYDDVSDKKKASAAAQQNFERIKQQRDIEVPRTQMRIGGLAENGGNGNMPMMPNMPNMPNMPMMPNTGGAMYGGMPNYGGSSMPNYGGGGMPNYGGGMNNSMPMMPTMPNMYSTQR